MEKVFGKGLPNRSAASKTVVNESSDRSDRLKGGSKNSGFKFFPILVFSVSAAFRLFGCGRRGYRSEKSKQVCFFSRLIASFGVILSSLISHIVHYVPSSTYKSTHENRTKINTT